MNNPKHGVEKNHPSTPNNLQFEDASDEPSDCESIKEIERMATTEMVNAKFDDSYWQDFSYSKTKTYISNLSL